MARSRNIKPGLYKNEDLAECSIWARYLFPGLWTMADRKGRMEDRPKRIKGELFAYDSVEVDPLLVELEAHGFIARYSVGGVRLIQILKFSRHQNPHKREQPSKLPEMPGFVEALPAAGEGQGDDEDGAMPGASGAISEQEASTLHCASVPSELVDARCEPGASTVHAPDMVEPRQERARLIPSSLIPDSLISDSGKDSGGGKPPLPPGFVRFWAVWPKHFRKESKGECAKAWVKAGAEAIANSVIAHVEAKKKSNEWAKDGGEYIPAPLVYINKRRWEGAEDGPAAGPKWWIEAGFANVDEAANRLCHLGNYQQFRDGKRIAEVANA